MTSGSYIAEVDAAPVWRLLVDVRELGCAIDPSGSSGDAVRIARALARDVTPVASQEIGDNRVGSTSVIR